MENNREALCGEERLRLFVVEHSGRNNRPLGMVDKYEHSLYISKIYHQRSEVSQ